MATIARYARSFLDAYHRLLKLVLTALMALLIIPVGLQIVSRYTDLIARYMWTEEVARFCFVWIVMIGSIIAVRDGSHFRVELFHRFATKSRRAISDLVVHVIMFFMALVFLWYGIDFARTGSMQNSEMSGINMLTIYISFPLAGGSWAVFLVERIVADLKRLSRRGSAE